VAACQLSCPRGTEEDVSPDRGARTGPKTELDEAIDGGGLDHVGSSRGKWSRPLWPERTAHPGRPGDGTGMVIRHASRVKPLVVDAEIGGNSASTF